MWLNLPTHSSVYSCSLHILVHFNCMQMSKENLTRHGVDFMKHYDKSYLDLRWITHLMYDWP